MTSTKAAPADIVGLWHGHAASLRTYFVRRVSSSHDADDLVQEVFLRAVRSAPANPGPGWLFTVARNVLTDHYRSAAHRRETPVDATADGPAASPDEPVNPAEQMLARCASAMLSELPSEQADALHQVDAHAVRQTIAAQQAGVSTSGMKSRVQLGRAHLRDLIQACCHIIRDARGGIVDCHPRNSRCGC